MTLKERELHNAYEPYNREALYCLRVDILLVLGLVIAFTLFGGWNYPQLYWVFPFYFLLELIFNYSLAILGFFERKLGLFLQKKIKIVRITEDYSPSGHWGSVIPKLYPKQVNVSRNKLICTDEDGKRLRLRSAMSGKKWQLLFDSIEANPSQCTVTFGKLTHIVISYDDQNELCFQLNHNF